MRRRALAGRLARLEEAAGPLLAPFSAVVEAGEKGQLVAPAVAERFFCAALAEAIAAAVAAGMTRDYMPPAAEAAMRATTEALVARVTPGGWRALRPSMPLLHVVALEFGSGADSPAALERCCRGLLAEAGLSAEEAERWARRAAEAYAAGRRLEAGEIIASAGRVAAERARAADDD